MPSRTPRPDRRFPEMLSRLRRLPQSKISRALLLVAIVVHARARLNSRQIDLRKFPILRKFRDPVVDRAFARIGERLLLQLLDQLHHVIDMIRGPDPVLRRLDAQRLAIVKKRLHELLGVIADALPGRRRIRDDAVVHVRQVHDVVQLESAKFQEPPQNVLKHERAVIADVRVVVDRRPARVHAHFARLLGDEALDLSGQRVVQLNFGHRL